MNEYDLPPAEVLTALLEDRDNLSAKQANFSAKQVTGGLSGASVWCIAEKYALRRWPKAIADPSWIEKTAQVLHHAYTHGVPFVPLPIAPAFQASNGDWWEVTTWCPGSPQLETDPTSVRIEAAIKSLAKFHQAVSDLSVGEGPSPAIQKRIVLLESCTERLPSQQAIPNKWRDIAERLARYVPPLAKVAEPLIKRFAEVAVPLQPVQIDSRPEHFLFTKDTVAGLIDFGAMRIDTPAVDVARLTGELAKGSHSLRNDYVRQYNELSAEPVNVELVEALDVSGAVLATANWLGWLADGRALQQDPLALRHRLENLANRADGLVASQ